MYLFVFLNKFLNVVEFFNIYLFVILKFIFFLFNEIFYNVISFFFYNSFVENFVKIIEFININIVFNKD